MKSNFLKIESQFAPKAIGPYSQAVKVGDFIFCSGQIGLIPEKGILSPGIKKQTIQIMQNIKNILSEEGLNFSNIIKTEIFIKQISDFETVNEIYATYFHEPFPARSTIEVSNLPKGALIEISCIAKK